MCEKAQSTRRLAVNLSIFKLLRGVLWRLSAEVVIRYLGKDYRVHPNGLYLPRC